MRILTNEEIPEHVDVLMRVFQLPPRILWAMSVGDADEECASLQLHYRAQGPADDRSCWLAFFEVWVRKTYMHIGVGESAKVGRETARNGADERAHDRGERQEVVSSQGLVTVFVLTHLQRPVPVRVSAGTTDDMTGMFVTRFATGIFQIAPSGSIIPKMAGHRIISTG
jgi:hypothetical protein